MTLDEVKILAEKYAKAAQQGNIAAAKEDMLLIETIACGFSALEMAYFCQQVVSWFANVHQASMCLTVFTNRINQE
jgi:hypothetical protein